jgi:3D (Asp-Asp-Asp) domain-containing protein
MGLLAFTGIVLYGRYITDMNIFVFHDGGEIIVRTSYAQSAMEAMKEAGIYLGNTDYIDALDTPIHGSVAEIIITRGYTVEVSFDDRAFSVPVYGGETVDSVLQRLDFEPRPGDIYRPTLDTPTTEGMLISVTRTNIMYVIDTQVLDFERIDRENLNLNEHTVVCVQEGVSGTRTDTYELTYANGELIDKAIILTSIVQPVPEIYEHGTRKTITTASGSVLVYSRRLECTATAYTTENRTRKNNAIGNVARRGTIAVDPSVIRLRSKVYVCGVRGPSQWEYGVAIAEDTGGFRGNHVDLFFDTYDECIQFGRRKVLVYVLE